MMIGTSDRARMLPTDVQPVHVGQAEVQEDDVRLVRLERSGAGRRPFDLEPFAPQALGERLGDRAFVLDDQHSHASILTHGPRRVRLSRRNLCGSRANLYAALGPSLRSGPPTVGASTGRSPDEQGSRRRNRATARGCRRPRDGGCDPDGRARPRRVCFGVGQSRRRPARRSPGARIGSTASRSALRRSLRSRPPKLPARPGGSSPGPRSMVASAPVAAAPPRVVYQRPPPIVVVRHHAHGDGRRIRRRRRRRRR